MREDENSIIIIDRPIHKINHRLHKLMLMNTKLCVNSCQNFALHIMC